MPLTLFTLLGVGLIGAQRDVDRNGTRNFTTIQAAINASVTGDVIVVWPGTYPENITFKGKSIEVVSARGPASTIIDAKGKGPAVLFDDAEGTSSILNGFTLKSGTGLASQGSPENKIGGGVAAISSSPTIKNNIITNNSAYAGGGIGVLFGSPQITNNIVKNNSVTRHGGGIFVMMGQPTLSKNRIEGNSTVSNLGEGGGAFFSSFDGRLLVEDCLFIKNTAARGAGVYVDYFGGTFDFNFNTVADNCSTTLSAGLESYSQSTGLRDINIVSSILWNNRRNCPSGIIDDFANITVSSQLFTSDTSEFNGGTNGNIRIDPQFVSPPTNYALQSGSPAAGKGARVFYTAFTGFTAFIRGDVQINGQVNYNDVNELACVLFSGCVTTCRLAMDTNSDGVVNISDVSYLSNYLNGTGAPPANPFPGCGVIAKPPAGLTCQSNSFCNP